MALRACRRRHPSASARARARPVHRAPARGLRLGRPEFGVTDVLPSPCLACGSRLGVRYPSGWLCAICEWRVGELPDGDDRRPAGRRRLLLALRRSHQDRHVVESAATHCEPAARRGARLRARRSAARAAAARAVRRTPHHRHRVVRVARGARRPRGRAQRRRRRPVGAVRSVGEPPDRAAWVIRVRGRAAAASAAVGVMGSAAACAPPSGRWRGRASACRRAGRWARSSASAPRRRARAAAARCTAAACAFRRSMRPAYPRRCCSSPSCLLRAIIISVLNNSGDDRRSSMMGLR